MKIKSVFFIVTSLFFLVLSCSGSESSDDGIGVIRDENNAKIDNEIGETDTFVPDEKELPDSLPDDESEKYEDNEVFSDSDAVGNDSDSANDQCIDGTRECSGNFDFKICIKENGVFVWSPQTCINGKECRGEGICDMDECVESEKRCVNSVSNEKCLIDENGFLKWEKFTCGENRECRADGVCDFNECLAGLRECSDGTHYRECGKDENNFYKWQEVTECGGGTECHGEGLCGNNECSPDVKRCSGVSTFQECLDESGFYKWSLPSSCGTGQFCKGDGVCDADECADGEKKCSSDTDFQVCLLDENGFLKFSSVTGCGLGLFCKGSGICDSDDCAEGEKECTDSVHYRECLPDGDGFLKWNSAVECSGSDECESGVCECVPDCSGKTCGSDGCGGSCGDCDPIGHLDQISSTLFRGWACDADEPGTSIKVHFHVKSGDELIIVETDTGLSSETAVNELCGGGDAHRFEYVPDEELLAKMLKNQGPYRVYAYGINVAGGNNLRIDNDDRVLEDGYGHSFPIPTHFDSINGFAVMAADQLEVYNSDPVYFYNYNYEPTYNQYVGTNYSTYKIIDQKALEWSWELYGKTAVPFKHLFPRTKDGADFNAAPLSGRKEVQIIHANIENSSLFTVILPPGWDENAAEGSYPILANGSYDSNQSVVEWEGPFMAEVIANSTKNGKKGAIGVIWNGGGATATLTMNSASRGDFAEIIDTLVLKYRANREWIVMLGASRGGIAALHMASNPDSNNYRVVMASAAEPATMFGSVTELADTTYRGLMPLPMHATGFQDAWKSGINNLLKRLFRP